jgi:hypothetical protein
MELLWIVDPGHGWLRVPREQVEACGVEVSSYSFIDHAFYYLEEDCDALAFLQKTDQMELNIPNRYVEDFQRLRFDLGIGTLR